MKSIKETAIYAEVLKEFNYSFGNVFIFDGFVVSEIKQGISFSWEHHGKYISEDLCRHFSTNGNNVIYISNRINSYSVIALDWNTFFENKYTLGAYYVVGMNRLNQLNVFVEQLFFKKRIRNFNCIYSAINEAKINTLNFA
ncbi:hypothetical protein ACFFU9_14700 [Mariniflexile ostreae]|uniref:Uncharacterized protein n=1 Tax=Mariniflexile ostreae TaxID=1520892 RepID=A0ABV5FEV2_9FLAO